MKTGAKAGFQKGKSLFDAVAEKAKNWLKCEKGCFLEDTNIWTESGRKAIQQIQAGDLVYARDEETGEVGLKKVKQVYETEAHTVYTITLGEGETEPIRTTNYHPFYEKEKGWVCAIQLQVGDRLCTIEGEEEVVTSIEKERVEEGVLVYNFEVEEWNSYYVAEGKVLVHNAAKRCGLVKWLRSKGGSNTNKLFKNQSLLDEHYGKHGQEIADVLGDSNYSIDKYLDDANYIINNGTYAPELNGYVSFMSGKKYGFVGLDRTTGDITTFHIKNISELIKKAPSLGFER
ncbi:polymorphic toxin-type HINT domain-containing protein [Velocimicrobium porci]|uniref:Hint domain-containing protein n=2 Tax=Lachnospiraceae TaxID=186803 RepID=A0A6L5XWY2_9FIRM|nr:polymorphic toxin-type HINT domain-containing protein [Velocimicrobium porci]MSS63124.1 hypothetical protein [Velocimicrobium porci]